MSDDATLLQRTAWAAVAVAVFLIAIKLFAYLASDSVAMLASLADSALDVFASSINVLAIRQALTPADADHRFGHGKAEPLAGLMQAAFIAGSVGFLSIESVNRLLQPRAVANSELALAITGLSIAITIGLVALQAIAVRRTRSLAIHADRMHYLGDLATNTGVIAGVVLSARFGILIADPVIGLVICAILAYSAYGVFRQSYDQLMDRELPDGDRARIRAIVMSHGEVRDLHDLRTRMAGADVFIQMHIELDPAISLTHAHEVSDGVEALLHAAFPNAEVIIHQDPAGLEAPPELARG